MLTWEAFNDAWRRGEWLVSTCLACGHAWETPRPACPRCGSVDATDSVARGGGVVRAWTRVAHRFGSRAAGEPPFTIAIVDMDAPEGLVLIGEVHTDGAIATGARVRVGSHAGADGMTRPVLVPTGA